MPDPRRSLAHLWLTLGFSAGLAFGWAAFRNATPPAAAAPVAPKAPIAAPERTEGPVNAGTLRSVEQMFERWGGYAVWEDDVTEIAAWDAHRKRHTDFYEVRRHDGKFYFRSLTALARPIVDHGINATIPLAFTEPQWMRDQFYREHPDYDPATEPRVDLPPKPPERYTTVPQRGFPISPVDSTSGAPPPRAPLGALTPGAGG